MAGLHFLDLVIGLVFIFLLYSLAVSTLRELYSNFLNLRAKNLQRWVKDGLDKNGFGEKILQHPVLKGISRKGRIPSYIPPHLFSEVFLQIIHSEGADGAPYDAASIKKKISETDLLPDEFKVYLLQRLKDANDDVAAVKKTIEDWFDSAMLRIGGTYKKHSQRFLLITSLILVLWTNVDTFQLIRYFQENPQAASALADQAELFVKDSSVMAAIHKIKTQDSVTHTSDSAIVRIEQNIQALKEMQMEVNTLSLPIGWKNDPLYQKWLEFRERDKKTLTVKATNELRKPLIAGFFTKLAGLLISALAISLGAPFWFETLNKLVNLRGAGKSSK